MIAVPARHRADLIQDLAFLALEARRYSVARTFVTALRSLIVSSIAAALSPPANRQPQKPRYLRITQ